MMTFARILAAFVCFAVATVSVARATTIVDRGIEGLAQRAERVVLARVTGQSVRVEQTGRALRLVTETTLAVEQDVAGPSGEHSLTLVQPGGTAWIGGEPRHHRVDGAARFEPGERVLVFLERAGDGRLVVAGMALGKFTIAADPQTGELTATRAAAGVDASRTVRAPTGPDEAAPVRLARPDPRARFPLAALVDRIRQASGDRVVTPSATVRP